MIDIFTIKDNFIINDKDVKAELISNNILSEYIDILRSDFYNEYLDFKFNSDISEEKLIYEMKNKIEQYDKYDINIKEFRFVILDSNRHIIGGYTLHIGFEIEIAYFVIPEYQGKGIASKALYGVISKLKYLGYNNYIVKLNIQEKNSKSLRLARKMQFKVCKKYKGRFGTNIELKRFVGAGYE